MPVWLQKQSVERHLESLKRECEVVDERLVAQGRCQKDVQDDIKNGRKELEAVLSKLAEVETQTKEARCQLAQTQSLVAAEETKQARLHDENSQVHHLPAWSLRRMLA